MAWKGTTMKNAAPPGSATGTSRRDILAGTAAITGLLLAFPSVAVSLGSRSEPTPNQTTGDKTMSTITTKDGTEIFYKDWGRRDAQPIAFHHGWPLSADDWDNQMLYFLDKGYRVIAHDRRGHGRSTQTATGNEMDTYAADVAGLAA